MSEICEVINTNLVLVESIVTTPETTEELDEKEEEKFNDLSKYLWKKYFEKHVF